MKSRQGTGTVRTVRSRQGEIIGYQALLPREYSIPPRDCKRPELFQQPVGERFATWDEARELLDAAILERRSGAVAAVLPFSHYVKADIDARLHEARRRYPTEALARKAVNTWRSMEKHWLKSALCSFYQLPPELVTLERLQPFFTALAEQAISHKGKPLSAHFVLNVAKFVRGVLARAGLQPNPADGLKLPDKGRPRVPHLTIAGQRRFYGSDVDLADRVMVGCGMGAGLRVNELLPFEIDDVRLDDHDPHLIVRYGGRDRSLTKGSRLRRVELVEPGLGFWRLWVSRFYKGGRLVFAGPKGGYLKSWPDNFPGWAAAAGELHMTSHVMRHSYAVSILSGSWGYEPKGIDFVQQQLGHADRSTTERYYGAFEVGTFQREARIMRGGVPVVRRPVTAAELLGLPAEGSNEGSRGGGGGGFGITEALSAISPVEFPSVSQLSYRSQKQAQPVVQLEGIPQAVDGCLTRAIEAFAEGGPTAAARALTEVVNARQLNERLLDAEHDREAEVG